MPNNKQISKSGKQKTKTRTIRNLFNPVSISKEKFEAYDKQNQNGYFEKNNIFCSLMANYDYDEPVYSYVRLCTKFKIVSRYCYGENQEFVDVHFFDRYGEKNEVKKLSVEYFSPRNLEKLKRYGFIYNSNKINEVVNLLNSAYSGKKKITVDVHPGWHFSSHNTLKFCGYQHRTYKGDTVLEVSKASSLKHCLKLTECVVKCPFKKAKMTCLYMNECDEYNKMLTNGTTTLFEHRTVINRLIKDSLPAQMIVAVSLSAALYGYLNMANVAELDSPLFHLYGDSSKGKTTALILAASMWGKPTQGNGLLHSWNATPSKILENLSDNNGVLFTLNEFGSRVSNTDFSNLVYCIADGSGKDRMYNKNQTVSTWHTVLLSCGENSLVDMLDGNKGLHARVFEFFNLDITLSASHADEIKHLCKNIYGAIGCAFVTYLLNHKAQTEDEFRSLRKAISRRVKKLSAISARVAEHIAVVALSAEIAHRLGLNISFTKVREMLIDNHMQAVKSLPSVVSNHDKLMSYVSRNGFRFPRASLYGFNNDGYVTPEQVVFVDSAFDDMCKKLNIDKGLFLSELKSNGYLDCPPDRYYKKKSVGGIKCKCYVVNKVSKPDSQPAIKRAI